LEDEEGKYYRGGDEEGEKKGGIQEIYHVTRAHHWTRIKEEEEYSSI